MLLSLQGKTYSQFSISNAGAPMRNQEMTTTYHRQKAVESKYVIHAQVLATLARDAQPMLPAYRRQK